MVHFLSIVHLSSELGLMPSASTSAPSSETFLLPNKGAYAGFWGALFSSGPLETITEIDSSRPLSNIVVT